MPRNNEELLHELPAGSVVENHLGHGTVDSGDGIYWFPRSVNQSVNYKVDN